jgi:hypothetical protein
MSGYTLSSTGSLTAASYSPPPPSGVAESLPADGEGSAVGADESLLVQAVSPASTAALTRAAA